MKEDSAAAAAPVVVRLFLVDDHPLVRDGLRARLGAMPGLEIVGEAGSAAEALALIGPAQPHLVLMDVGMKDMNGIELAALLLQQQPQHQKPAPHIVMLSMYDNPEYVQKALQVGARGYVLKDAPAAEIVAAIEAVSAGGTFLSPAVSKKLFRNQTPRPLLTPRESEILSALGRGESSKQIARDLGLSVRTVEAHRQSIKRRLGIEGQAELIKYAVEHAREFGGQG
ncbi:DNA-binding NarL/FixJ family response regulator [Variovorax boronicumulans]|uniref:DNA-binding NarL/FixJ family response regulator n=1 Tax=Variovorax boronicumulans TaxID=436515 RepID=A0AAW8DYC2_9BURK|nr:response regulator transcription factor [Variovorax boronicumulans]MDP9879043.1 DNA-binding NarL/FixJ family response regulator [Variovorax boronicumulans]MDP9924327.1 DNA-binding NarL/FixJ family response regulator [Variovorax boronicumulans]